MVDSKPMSQPASESDKKTESQRSKTRRVNHATDNRPDIQRFRRDSGTTQVWPLTLRE